MKHKWTYIYFGIAISAFFGATAFLITAILMVDKTAVGQAQIIALAVVFCIALVIGTVYLLMQRLKNEKTLLEGNRKYEELIANIQGGVITCLFDPKTATSCTTYISEGWTKLTGYTLKELNEDLHGNPQALVFPADKESANSAYLEQSARGSSYGLQYRVIRKDGSIIWAIDRGVVSTDSSGKIQNQSIITEVTEIKEKEEQLWKLAQTDPLTGLCNKSMTESLSESFLGTQGNVLHAMMMLDIDNFKGVNDNFGHIFGDTVLIEVSARLRRLFRNQDVIGRIGGDEFLVLMSGLLSKELAAKKAEEVCATFRNTYMGEVGTYKISCSMGIAFSTDSRDYNELLRKADTALYEAKTRGKDRYVIYSGDEGTRGAGEGRTTRADQPREKDSGALEIKDRIFEVLYSSLDFIGSVNLVLSLLGQIPDVGRVYVYESDADNRFAHSTFEWCARGVMSVRDERASVPIADVGYMKMFDENGIFCCADIGSLSPEIRAVLSPGQARAVMQVAIKENGVIRGFVGCDNLRKATAPTNENFNVIHFSAKVIGVFVLKRRAEEKAEQLLLKGQENGFLL